MGNNIFKERCEGEPAPYEIVTDFQHVPMREEKQTLLSKMEGGERGNQTERTAKRQLIENCKVQTIRLCITRRKKEQKPSIITPVKGCTHNYLSLLYFSQKCCLLMQKNISTENFKKSISIKLIGCFYFYLYLFGSRTLEMVHVAAKSRAARTNEWVPFLAACAQKKGVAQP